MLHLKKMLKNKEKKSDLVRLPTIPILVILPVATPTTEITYLHDTAPTLTSTLNSSIVTISTAVILKGTTTPVCLETTKITTACY